MVAIKDYGMIGSGVECDVYNIGNSICYKRYDTINEAASAYKYAVIAYDNGIGPAVYDRNDYGYETEIVDIFGDVSNCRECKGIDCNTIRECCDIFRLTCFLKSINKVFGLSEYIADLHVFNIGIKDGKYLMVDFGCCSGIESNE